MSMSMRELRADRIRRYQTTIQVPPQDIKRVRKAMFRTVQFLLSAKGKRGWHFRTLTIPECNTKGCCAGWVGYFLGVCPGNSLYHAIPGITYPQFSDMMETIEAHWHHGPKTAARTLRKFVDIYVPLPKRDTANTKEAK